MSTDECIRLIEEYCEEYCRVQVKYRRYLVEEGLDEEEAVELCLDECLQDHRDVVQECYEIGLEKAEESLEEEREEEPQEEEGNLSHRGGAAAGI